MSHKTKAMRLQNSSRNDDWEAHHATQRPTCPEPGCGQELYPDIDPFTHETKWICTNTLCPSVKIMAGVKWSRK
jgi:hypothetical protein